MPALDRLTPRQQQVLKLIASGLSNNEIAQQLNISSQTVKNHVSLVFKNLEVSNRAEASSLYSQLSYAKRNLTDPKLSILILYRQALEPQTLTLLKEFSALLEGWEIFSAELLPQELANRSDYQYTIEFEQFNDEQANEYSWTISRFDPESGAANEINYFEKIQNQLDSHALIDIATLIYKTILDNFSSLSKSANDNKSYNQLFFILHLFNLHDQELQDQILKTCDQVINEMPNWSIPHAIKTLIYYRGMTHFQLDMNQQNLERFSYHANRAHQLAPTNNWAKTAYAHHNMVAGDVKAAKQLFEESLKSNPCNYIAAALLVQLYAFQGDYLKGKALIDSVRNNHSDIDTVINIPTALTILHYFSGNLCQSKKTASDGLLYKDANSLVMLLILISIAEIQNNLSELEVLIAQWNKININMRLLDVRLKFIKNFLSEKSYHQFTESLKRAGLKINS